MIYFIGLISGFINGLFASGAGQILVFYLVFIKKMNTYKTRAVSIALLSLASIISFCFYFKFAKLEITKCIIIASISSIGGIIGSKIMKKLNANLLNLISGLFIMVLTLYKIFCK